MLHGKWEAFEYRIYNLWSTAGVLFWASHVHHIYINDLHLRMKHCDVNMYADDTRLMFASDSITHINDYVNDDLINLKSCFFFFLLYVSCIKA